MKCLDPVLCYTGDNVRLFRNFSLASRIIKETHQLVFDCGKCIFCRRKRAFELAARCVLHSSLYPQNCFLTLTYDESKAGYHNDFEYQDIQKFKKRLRAHCARTFKKKIEIFNVHEYGKNGKKHWHLIVFNHDFADKVLFTVKNSHHIYTSPFLTKLWPFGFNTIGDVSTASAMYQAQYCEKDFKHGNEGSKKSHSKHSGLGRPYFLKHYDQILRLGYIPFGDRKMPLPRYFQKLAHKHYCHFYDKQYFFDTKHRKRRYAPFKDGEANKNIADLYLQYYNLKQEKIEELERQWSEVISRHIETGETPEFKLSAENAIYDLRNKNVKGTF